VTAVHNVPAQQPQGSRPEAGVHVASTALNRYADRPDVFSADTEEIGSTFATHAAAALKFGRRPKHLRKVLTNRDVIGQAKAMLMERFDIDAVAAFSLLAQLSRDRRDSVSATARRLVHAEP
jgi:hypothetical protein